MLDENIEFLVESYFVDDKYIYASSAGEVRLLPNTLHNIQFCNDQIHTQVEVFRTFSSFSPAFFGSGDISSRLAHLNTCIWSFLNKNYLSNLCFLHDHLEEVEEIWTERQEEISEVYGKPLELGTLLAFESDEIHQMTKLLKRDLRTTRKGRGMRS